MNISEKDKIQKTSVIKKSSNLLHDINLPLFLTSKQLGRLLNMSTETAIELLKKYNILPIDLGRGRSKGLRWRTSAVIEVADILHTEAQAKKFERRIKKSSFTIRGKSAADLFAEFNGCTPLKAEVCNGN